ncbi:MAG: BTAD domain-containing putative transcriptional regulator [Clostridia bacterium]|nr:BTAD domain-containing putative transcriptional regulator [Clostridia bacterium]
MAAHIHVSLLGGFHVTLDGVNMDAVINKSRKGMALMQFLILEHGQAITTSKLIEIMWGGETSTNPENALKTLISRFRVILGQISPDLSACIATERGSYRWKSNENVSVDVYEFEDLAGRLLDVNVLDEETAPLFRKAIHLYAGDLLSGDEKHSWYAGFSSLLNDNYLKLVYHYLGLLEQKENWEEIISVCRHALDVDAFDEQLHLQLMNALIKTNRNNEALMQYKHVTNLHYHYLGVQPPEGVQEFYKQIAHVSSNL